MSLLFLAPDRLDVDAAAATLNTPVPCWLPTQGLGTLFTAVELVLETQGKVLPVRAHSWFNVIAV